MHHWAKSGPELEAEAMEEGYSGLILRLMLSVFLYSSELSTRCGALLSGICSCTPINN